MQDLAKHYAPMQCSICMEDMVRNLVSTPCGHIYHEHCLYNNQEYRSVCPLCRTRVQQCTIIPLKFEMLEENESDKTMQKFMNTLTEDEKLNVDTYIIQNKKLIDESILLKKQTADAREDLEKEAKRARQAEEQLNILKADALSAKQKYSNCKITVNELEVEREELLALNNSFRAQIIRLEDENLQLSRLKELKKYMDGDSEEKKYLETLKTKSLPEQIEIYKSTLFFKNSKINTLQQSHLHVKAQLDELKVQVRDKNQLQERVQVLEEKNRQQAKKIEVYKQKYQAIRDSTLKEAHSLAAQLNTNTNDFEETFEPLLSKNNKESSREDERQQKSSLANQNVPALYSLTQNDESQFDASKLIYKNSSSRDSHQNQQQFANAMPSETNISAFNTSQNSNGVNENPPNSGLFMKFAQSLPSNSSAVVTSSTNLNLLPLQSNNSLITRTNNATILSNVLANAKKRKLDTASSGSQLQLNTFQPTKVHTTSQGFQTKLNSFFKK